MRVPERGDADAGHEVEVRASLIVEQPHAVAALEHHRLTPVVLQHVLELDRLDVTSCLHRRHFIGLDS